MNSICYFYILKCNSDTKYYGHTNNLERRLTQHNQEENCELIYYEAYKAEADAHNRERHLKQYAQALTALKRRLEESLK